MDTCKNTDNLQSVCYVKESRHTRLKMLHDSIYMIFMKRQTIETENRSGWGGYGVVLNWAIGIDMYTLMCIKLMPNKNLQYKKTNKQNN